MSELPVEQPRVTQAGRYQLGEILGAGAMGVVYAARDPELGRSVAVKILRAGQSHAAAQQADEHRARLLRESRSLARVVHPNVVSIFDVGETETGVVFLVMELLEGGTLRAWLRAEPRSFDEVVRMFEAIGQGLAAAHAAGLVHRDFKPENVILGKDGQPRVTDFGLARGEASDLDARPSAPLDQPVLALTQTGDLLGTPAYMSLEQLYGQTADARADQFAFAVALWEALFGARPFGGDTLGELAVAIDQRRYRAPAAPPHPPERLARIRPILERALSPRPDDRYPTLEALLVDLRALGPRPRPARRWLVPVAAVGLLAAAGGLGLVWRDRLGARCKSDPIDEVWQGRLRPRLIAAASSATSPASKDLAAQALAALDDYAGRLAAVRRSACEATYIARAQPEAAWVAQSECLFRQQTRFGLTATTITTTPPNWQRAVELATRLEDPADCRSAPVRALPKAGTAVERQQLLTELETVIHDVSAGKLTTAEAQLDQLRARAKQLGDETIEAEAMLVTAQIKLRQGNVDAARQLVNDGIAAALTHQATDLALKGYAIGTRVFANGYKSVDDAERMARLFEALSTSTGRGAALRPRVLAALADAYSQQGRHQEALALLEKGLGTPEANAQARAELGHALGKTWMNLGKPNEAMLAMDRAIIDAVAGFGADTTMTLAIVGERVWVDFAVGGPARALAGQRRFVAQVERLGEDNPRLLIDALANLGGYLGSAEQDEESLAVTRRAAALAEKYLPEDSPNRINPTISLASKLVDAKHEDEALPILDKLRSVVDPEGPPEKAPASAVFLNITYAHALAKRNPTKALEHIARMRVQAQKFAKRPDVAEMLKEADELEKQLRVR